MKRSLSILAILAITAILAISQTNDIKVTSITFNLTNIPQPVSFAGISAQRLDNPGSCSYYYWVVANYLVGNAGPAGPAAITNGGCSLVNGNRVSWGTLPAAQSYDVLRTSTPTPPTGACGCAVATGNTTGTVTDTGSLNAYTVTTFNPQSVQFTLDNENGGGPGVSLMEWKVNGVVVATLDSTGVFSPKSISQTGPFLAPNGTAAAPAYAFASATNTGWFLDSNLHMQLSESGVPGPFFGGLQVSLGSTGNLNFYNTVNPNSGSPDSSISRCGVAIICFGNGTNGDNSAQIAAQIITWKNAAGTAQINTVLPGGAFSVSQTLQGVTDTFVYRATTDTLTNKTFDTAGAGNVFKVNGTQLSTVQGNTSKVQLAVSFSNLNFPEFDASGNINDSGKAVPTGAVVGTTDTQTLTNKTAVGLGAGGTNTLTITPNHQVFTSSGTFTIPNGVTAVKVTVVAGGGAGGGAATNGIAGGGGGGAGGFAIKWLTGLTPANTLTVTVGTGGSGVSAGNGNAGGASSVSSGTQTITSITTNGGGGGQTSCTSGAGGAVGSGDDIHSGGNPGATATGTGTCAGDAGGAGVFGGAAAGTPGAANGNAATGPGSGGGGSGNPAGAGGPFTGGAGANGIVIFEWVN